MSIVHVFSSSAKALNFIDEKNKKARKYRWHIKSYQNGWKAYRVKKRGG